MHTNFVPFELERIMSIWEHQVDYNLSESGVHPLTVGELLENKPNLIEKLLNTELNYPPTNGTIQLRDQISALYPGTTRENVVVTTGAAQANFTSILTLLDPGDEIVIMVPNYMQIWGVAKNLNLSVKTFSLKEKDGWKVDVEELKKVVSNKTKLIAVCNPNNPTGHIMSIEEMQAVVGIADQAGAWILADEVYAGAEHDPAFLATSFWGTYEKVLAIGSLSKAYGLPGLRIGWVVCPKEIAAEIWARQDYVTICSTILGNELGAYALSPEVRPRLINRTRTLIKRGYDNFSQWCENNSELVSFTPPNAAAIVFIQYHREINSSVLMERLIKEKKVYIVPGDHFGLDHHLRISYGLSNDYVNEGLSRLTELLMTVK